jgi:hypothetical protein
MGCRNLCQMKMASGMRIQEMHTILAGDGSCGRCLTSTSRGTLTQLTYTIAFFWRARQRQGSQKSYSARQFRIGNHKTITVMFVIECLRIYLEAIEIFSNT